MTNTNSPEASSPENVLCPANPSEAWDRDLFRPGPEGSYRTSCRCPACSLPCFGIDDEEAFAAMRAHYEEATWSEGPGAHNFGECPVCQDQLDGPGCRVRTRRSDVVLCASCADRYLDGALRLDDEEG